MAEGSDAKAHHTQPDPGEAFIQPCSVCKYDLQDHQGEEEKAGGVRDILQQDNHHICVERSEGEDASQEPPRPGRQAVLIEKTDPPGDGEAEEEDLGDDYRGRGEPDPGDQPHGKRVEDGVGVVEMTGEDLTPLVVGIGMHHPREKYKQTETPHYYHRQGIQEPGVPFHSRHWFRFELDR